MFKIVARYLEAFSVKESLVRRGGCEEWREEGRVCMCEEWREEGRCACEGWREGGVHV